jgi:site-specific DNA recombinase
MNSEISNPQLPLPTGSALYGRVSTGQQETTTQDLRGKEYLSWKKLPLAAEFYDDDVSGTIPIWERPGGRALRKRMEAGDIKHLVVVKLDRLGRSAIDLLKTVQFLDSLGITLHIVDMGGDSLSTQGASGRLMFTVLAGMAEYERELIRSRIQDKLDVKRDRGELCGTVPYGWNAIETGEVTPKGVKVRRLEANPEEQHWILVMHKLRAANFSYGKIAQHLNLNKVPTKRDKGTIMKLRTAGNGAETKFVSGKWQCGNVAKILQNKVVTQWLATAAAKAA